MRPDKDAGTVPAARAVLFCAATIIVMTVTSAFGGAAEVQRIRVHASQTVGTVNPIWRFVGYDEANFTFMPDGRRLLRELSEMQPQPFYFRAHHLLTSGDGDVWLKWSSTDVYHEDAQGNPVYDWTLLDRIFDTYLEFGHKPLVELANMPKALTSHPEDYTPQKKLEGDPGGAVGGGSYYPPKDYEKWGRFIEDLVRHCVERYGRAEVASWLWEPWNEPNIRYWQGTLEEYLMLYDHSAAAVKRVLPEARFGGPHVAGPDAEFLRAFLEHCVRGTNYATGETGSPLDFIAFHAKGGTRVVDEHVQMDVPNHLRLIDRGCRVAGSFPELREVPVIVGESDPDGCAACSSRYFPRNAYRNGSQYASYTAATFMRKQAVAALHGMHLEGALTWAFEFENQPLFAGFRTLSTQGIAKPVLNTFRMFSLLESTQVAISHPGGRNLEEIMARSARGTPDVGAVATRGDGCLSVIVWHHHDDGVPGTAVPVELAIDGLPDEAGQAKLIHYRIDDDHSNAYTVWQGMGSPETVTAEQYRVLLAASELALLEPVRSITVSGNEAEIHMELPRHAVSLIRLEY